MKQRLLTILVNKHLITGNLCLPLLEMSGNVMWSGKCTSIKIVCYIMAMPMPTQAANVDTDDIGESGVEQQQQQQCMFVPWKDAMNCLTAVFSV